MQAAIAILQNNDSSSSVDHRLSATVNKYMNALWNLELVFCFVLFVFVFCFLFWYISSHLDVYVSLITFGYLYYNKRILCGKCSKPRQRWMYLIHIREEIFSIHYARFHVQKYRNVNWFKNHFPHAPNINKSVAGMITLHQTDFQVLCQQIQQVWRLVDESLAY